MLRRPIHLASSDAAAAPACMAGNTRPYNPRPCVVGSSSSCCWRCPCSSPGQRPRLIAPMKPQRLPASTQGTTSTCIKAAAMSQRLATTALALAPITPIARAVMRGPPQRCRYPLPSWRLPRAMCCANSLRHATDRTRPQGRSAPTSSDSPQPRVSAVRSSSVRFLADYFLVSPAESLLS